MIGGGSSDGGRSRSAVVLALQCLVVIACVAVTTWAAAASHERQLRDATVERVLAVAESLAELDQVHEILGRPDLDIAQATAELQPLADLIHQASGVDYVVITDADGIRITHPTPAERGRPVSTDPGEVLDGETFVGTETGTLGTTLRAKVPVVDDGEVVGTASVGILESEIADDQRAVLAAVVPWTLGALVVGCLAAALLARFVNRRVRRLEGQVAELQTQRRIAGALREATHEFHTRLHVVYGLVEDGDAPAALDYIADLVPVAGADGAGAHLSDARLQAVIGAAARELAERDGELAVDPLSVVAAASIVDDDITVISNLVRNAVESAERHVGVRIQADESGLDVVVEDDGPGVPAEALPRLFDHGYSTKESEEDFARGVGLALVMQIVERRGGHVDVGDSALGGARFAVNLPAPAPAGQGTRR